MSHEAWRATTQSGAAGAAARALRRLGLAEGARAAGGLGPRAQEAGAVEPYTPCKQASSNTHTCELQQQGQPAGAYAPRPAARLCHLPTRPTLTPRPKQHMPQTHACDPTPAPAVVLHRRALLQAPGAYGDNPAAYTDNSLDPWGTAGGYYDPYGPGYIPGFVNVDVSKQYGTHVDVGPVAVDLTQDYAGLALGALAGVGVARDGRGFDVQLGNGNIMDFSVTKGAGFGLWLLNGLVNINIGPDGRWNAVASASTSGGVVSAAATNSTVQGMQDAAAAAMTAASADPAAAAAAAAAAGALPAPAASPPAAAVAAPAVAAAAAPAAAAAAAGGGVITVGRKPCEGGVVVKVEGEGPHCLRIPDRWPACGQQPRRCGRAGSRGREREPPQLCCAAHPNAGSQVASVLPRPTGATG